MESTDSDLFDVLFAGECLEGHDVSAVRAGLGKLFRADEGTLDKLFSGKPQRIKGSVDQATALKYEKAMASAGARAVLRAAGADGTTAAAAPAAQGAATGNSSGPESPGTDDGSGSGMTLAPPGSDVLRPDERIVPTGAAPDTAHLSVAPPGERLGEESRQISDIPPTPDFDIAAVGSNLGEGTETPALQAPDTSKISLHDGDLNLSDCAPEPAVATAINLEHLSVADVGGDLLAEEERARDDATAPDTSHLALSDPDPS